MAFYIKWCHYCKLLVPEMNDCVGEKGAIVLEINGNAGVEINIIGKEWRNFYIIYA